MAKNVNVKRPTVYSFILPNGIGYRITNTQKLGTYRFDKEGKAQRVAAKDAFNYICSFDLLQIMIAVDDVIYEKTDIEKKQLVMDKVKCMISLQTMGASSRSIFESALKQVQMKVQVKDNVNVKDVDIEDKSVEKKDETVKENINKNATSNLEQWTMEDNDTNIGKTAADEIDLDSIQLDTVTPEESKELHKMERKKNKKLPEWIKGVEKYSESIVQETVSKEVNERIEKESIKGESIKGESVENKDKSNT